jgi:hypothetical protein
VGATFELIDGFGEILYGGDDEDDNDSILLRLVVLTFPK